MLPHSVAAVVCRNETWRGGPPGQTCATEPYECGWAREAAVFVRALRAPQGAPATARVQVSADGMHWADEGTTLLLPGVADGVSFSRVSQFGGWLRLAADMPDGCAATLLVTLHLKA